MFAVCCLKNNNGDQEFAQDPKMFSKVSKYIPKVSKYLPWSKIVFSKVSKMFFKISKYFSRSTIIFQSLKIFLDILAASSMRPLSQYLLWGIRFHVFPKIDRDKTFFSCSMFLFHLCNCSHKDKEFHPI